VVAGIAGNGKAEPFYRKGRNGRNGIAKNSTAEGGGATRASLS